MNHEAAADDANAAATACVPPDVLASVLLRLPATDVRRFRRVCKDWREVISDPVFIKEHMDHGPSAPTHTLAFLHGREEESPVAPAATQEPLRNGHGFLFDEEWRLVDRFTTGDSEEMVGTCNGLLCFLDIHRAVIKVVEPFTGESLDLPLPPKTDTLHDGGAYCFGFDPVSRRYKIFHLGLNNSYNESTEQGLYVYTIGGGENWKRVPTSEASAADDFCRDLVFAADGSLYWSIEDEDQFVNLARFNLATEEITSTPLTGFLPVDRDRRFNLKTDSDARMCVMTVGDFGEWDVFSTREDGRWTTQNGYSSGLTLHPRRHLTSRQALQRGHLLLQESQDYRDGGLYAHPIEPAAHDLGSGKLLLKIRKEKDKEPAVKSNNTPLLFVPALLNQAAVPQMVVPIGRDITSTFCYAPPVSPAPLAHRCGFSYATSCGKQT